MIDRRSFLRRGALFGGAMATMGPLHALGARLARGQGLTTTTGYGPLVLKGDLWLPAAFNYTIISRQFQPMSDGSLTPGIFDGMAAFRGQDDTTILIRNHENRRRAGEVPVVVPANRRYDPDPTYNGGCTKLVVRKRRGVPVVVRSFAVLGSTDTNCAGGVKGRSWITCEEVVNRSAAGLKHGYNYEVPADARGPVTARPLPAQGRFVHEAVGWLDGKLYETEDRGLSADVPLGLLGACLYQYTPDAHDDDDDDGGRRLARGEGRLEALKLRDEVHANMDTGRVVGQPYAVEWVPVLEPDHDDDTDNRRDRVPGFTPTRVQAQDRGAAFFDRQEGCWVACGKFYFDCTTGGAQNLGQVWEYDPRRETITLIFESTNPGTEDPQTPGLQNPDNVVVVPKTGDIFLQEDGAGEQFIRGLTLDGEIYNFARTATNGTEFCGGCFDPNGRILYVNQQGERGGTVAAPPAEPAVTYAIWGPFGKRAGFDGERECGDERDDDDDDD